MRLTLDLFLGRILALVLSPMSAGQNCDRVGNNTLSLRCVAVLGHIDTEMFSLWGTNEATARPVVINHASRRERAYVLTLGAYPIIRKRHATGRLHLA